MMWGFLIFRIKDVENQMLCRSCGAHQLCSVSPHMTQCLLLQLAQATGCEQKGVWPFLAATPLLTFVVASCAVLFLGGQLLDNRTK